MRARYRGKRTALSRVGGAFPGNGDQSRAKDWLRSRRRNCKGECENRTHGSRNCTGEKGFAGKGTRARVGPDQYDRAGRNWRRVTCLALAVACCDKTIDVTFGAFKAATCRRTPKCC